ncbi:hypothetical protein [Kordia sp.]|uniref:hypothetical protein n=1 Tax=Kordia sp. TaxID=1965332 RepID=UPI0025BAF5A9|nr:hypothetical protein [Kordia sp.]MCH2196457.1 hypothetical protein [Kordia sp.]
MKLFNKQRFAIMGGTNFKKYLTYALGEIVLVVIGILIAVALNNWNQRKELNNANAELRMEVIKQLDTDITSISEHLNKSDNVHENYRKYLQHPKDSAEIFPGEVLGSLLFDNHAHENDTRVITMIDNATLNKSKTSLDLKSLAMDYRLYNEKLKSTEQLIFITTTEVLKEIERTQDWYLEFVMSNFQCTEDCANYFFNNKQHKARIVTLLFLYKHVYNNIVSKLKDILMKYRNLFNEIED